MISVEYVLLQLKRFSRKGSGEGRRGKNGITKPLHSDFQHTFKHNCKKKEYLQTYEKNLGRSKKIKKKLTLLCVYGWENYTE